MARRAARATPAADEPVKDLDELWDELEELDRQLAESKAALLRELGPIIERARREKAARAAAPATMATAEPAPVEAPAPASPTPDEPPAPPAESRLVAPPPSQSSFSFDAPVPAAAHRVTASPPRPRRARTTSQELAPVTRSAAAPRPKTLSEAARAVLDAVSVEGTIARLPPDRLDRKVYEEVDAALGSLGGTWNRGKKGHVFAEDPREAIEALVLTGEFIPPADLRKAFQAFFTPAPLAARLVEYAEIEPGMRVLEPSAGRGAIVEAVMRLSPGAVLTCVELQPGLVEYLRAHGAPSVVEGDFLELQDGVGEPLRFDRVVMNPPFTGGQDVAHVRRAFDFWLRPGGRLVAVMSAGVKFRTTGPYAGFREFLDRHCVIEEENPPGTFAESGTDVATVNVVLVKPEEA